MASSAATAKKLVVCGGNGFLGSRICKAGVLRGWDVTSISRSGEPQWKAVTGSPAPPSWARQVSWERADIFRPETYAPLFRGANYAVHSLGILLEADYKGVLSGKDSPLEGVRKMLAGSQGRQDKPQPDSSSSSSSSSQMTYETMNRDSALLVARAAAEAGVDAFAYVSAAAGAPVLPARYIGSKREAERLLTAAANPEASSFPSPLHRPVFIRAPFLYDAAARPLTVPLAALVGAGALFNRAAGGALSGVFGSAVTKPLKADDVADAVVEALSDDTIHGPVEVDQLVQLAERAWRKSML
ncbi:NAD dependent epimerase dehydratase family protein [Grosmannia clavigera kw1407]|uniref:NAD dependent epimerase dehydratase family protein n=1 Tax=Grosmannia clavigera (strain kw1407 / UAMH 11150) TaxID=655863 RepID=F0XC15_GROCL|nr:NAD dependent epimerase dehydratase family protein [Grosmannia clavigera kw1407]EFX04488.1 NAD dependent epimerase dehydratase family protein [Grosmannia clavigera kw1407]